MNHVLHALAVGHIARLRRRQHRSGHLVRHRLCARARGRISGPRQAESMQVSYPLTVWFN